jgi:peptidoglycan/xylan/chitin deacetylase (PgdA/CDA1 family)
VSAPGTFLLTFDVELLWGVFFDAGWRRRALERWGPVREVFAEILAILDRHEVPATFAVTGHLFLESCERSPDGRAHPEMPRPKHRGVPGDWYAFDPGTDAATDPLWYGPDLVRAIREAGVDHEIGCHGFSHAFLDGGRELARAEIAAAAAAARDAGVEPRSFVYPQNRVAFTDELTPAGFTCYREHVPVASRKLSFLLRAMGETPRTGRPRLVNGAVQVPGGIPMIPALGVRRVLSMKSRLREVSAGLEAAAVSGEVFHLWTHPHNFVEGRDTMLEYLDRAMDRVARARAAGEVEVMTMAEVEP